MLALATADEVVGSGFTGGSASVGIERPASAPASEALLGTVRALERLAAASAEDAIAPLAGGARGLTLGGIGRAGLAGRSLFETLLDLGPIGGQPFFELFAKRAQTLATARGPSVAGTIFCRALRDEIAAAIDVIRVELALLS